MCRWWIKHLFSKDWVGGGGNYETISFVIRTVSFESIFHQRNIDLYIKTVNIDFFLSLFNPLKPRWRIRVGCTRIRPSGKNRIRPSTKTGSGSEKKMDPDPTLEKKPDPDPTSF